MLWVTAVQMGRESDSTLLTAGVEMGGFCGLRWGRRGSDYWQILKSFLSGIFKGCVTCPNSDGVKECLKEGIVWALSDVSSLMSELLLLLYKCNCLPCLWFTRGKTFTLWKAPTVTEIKYVVHNHTKKSFSWNWICKLLAPFCNEQLN